MAEEAGERPRISAVVTTFNEERNVGDCVESLLWCDEVVVVDSYSTDRTPEIATSFDKVRFMQRPYLGSASQKNWAMDQAQYDWILIFDADERCTPQLQEEIVALLRSGPRHEAFTIKRRAYFMHRVIRFSGWQHDRVVRLIRRGAARYPNKRVHADMVTRDRTPVLHNPMLHFMIDSFDEYVPRIVKYGYWGAAQAWRNGRSAGFFEVIVRPSWRFIRTYVIQLGFLDGMAGLVFCMLQAVASYVKWSTLWAWRVNARRGRMPVLPPFDEDEQTWELPGAEKAERALGERESGVSPPRGDGVA